VPGACPAGLAGRAGSGSTEGCRLRVGLDGLRRECAANAAVGAPVTNAIDLSIFTAFRFFR